MVIGASAIVATALDEPEAPRSADIVLEAAAPASPELKARNAAPEGLYGGNGKRHRPHLPDPLMACGAVAIDRGDGAAGARRLCEPSRGVPEADGRDRHPARRIPDRRDHGRPVA